ncbi:MAG: thiamine-phosphate kinase [Micavibrio sp.]|nr:thiamine-phosphate kinase [Micavibrio sp.]
MNEFELIDKYFGPLSGYSLSDDAAVMAAPAGCELVITTDMLNEGVHFWKGEEPRFIAHKALRANLSDLASMGASPLCYQLALGLPKGTDEAWVAEFSAALAEDQQRYNLHLSGGDTTTTLGGVCVSITAIGAVKTGKAVTRGGARKGDLIVITGAVGDAYIGLKILQGDIDCEEGRYFLERYRMPSPRTHLVEEVSRYGRAAADISDGLMADCGHIARQSRLKGVIEPHKVQYSSYASVLLDQGKVQASDLLSGGDDYELVMAVAPEAFQEFQDIAATYGVDLQAIGHFENGTGVVLRNENGDELEPLKTGWKHFD